MPYVVLEAIAAGMPIVTTNVGGIPEIFGPQADELVPAGDPDALAGAIKTLLAISATPDGRRHCAGVTALPRNSACARWSRTSPRPIAEILAQKRA